VRLMLLDRNLSHKMTTLGMERAQARGIAQS
jgi:hypothetical protein